LLVFFSPLAAEQSQAFWPDFLGNAFGAAMDFMLQNIKGIMLGAAKKAAVTALQKEVSFMITGRSSGGAMFVTDWNDYLLAQPTSKADLYINDYITQSTSGRGSMTAYIPASGEGIGGGSYISVMMQGAKSITSNRPTQPVVTYTGNPSRMFAGASGFANMNLYLSGINNPWAFNLNVQQSYQQKLNSEQQIAQAKVISGQGFIGQESDGITTTPGSLIKDQVSKVQTMGVDVLANANNLPEVIMAAVSAIISQSITQGVGNIQSSVNREISNVRAQSSAQQNSAVQTSGPGALYKR
jgi:hypothetical protein